MFQTIELLDAVKQARSLHSDYALAKYLKVSVQSISQYRNKGISFSDELAIRVANELEISPLAVLASMHAQRANCDLVRDTWSTFADKFSGNNPLKAN